MNYKNLLYLLIFISTVLYSQQNSNLNRIDSAPFADNSRHWYGVFEANNIIQPPAIINEYKPEQVSEVADNILLYQKNNGGWPKNYCMFAILNKAQKDSLIHAKNAINTTFDNGTTYTQVAALSIAYKVTGKIKYKDAAQKGLNFILEAQYSNGGWPQYFPLEKDNYSSHITYNDGAMIGVMKLLKDIKDKFPQYDFIGNKTRIKVDHAFEKGIDCILKTQINDSIQTTVWCQQHDEENFKPVWARKFEPPCICNGESAEIVLFLMSIDNPNETIKKSIENAVVWFASSKIYNTSIKTVSAPKSKTRFKTIETDRIVVNDSNSTPIWTRYYELNTYRPMFSDRDSKIIYSLSEVSRERRVGYAWYTYEPQKVLNKYPEWKKKWEVK